MNDVVSYLIAGALAVLSGGYVVYAYHSTWKLYARFAKDWEERASYYAESLERFSTIKTETLPDDTALVIMTCRRHDNEGLDSCSYTAAQWRNRIPARLRDYYMRRP